LLARLRVLDGQFDDDVPTIFLDMAEKLVFLDFALGLTRYGEPFGGRLDREMDLVPVQVVVFSDHNKHIE